MLRLPLIHESAPACRLPIADATAERVAAALLVEDLSARAGQFKDLFAEEAALLAWTIARAWHAHGLELRTLTAAAHWLAEHALAELAFGWQAETEATAASTSAEATAPTPNELERWLPPFVEQQRADSAAGSADDTAAVASLVAQALAAWQADSLPGEEAEHEESATSTSPQEAFANCLPALVARLARLETLEKHFGEQLELEKLLAMKELAYGAGHEINNPLANIATRAQTLLLDETDPERRRKLATINSQAFRAHEMIADMMLYAHPPRPEPAPTDLREVVARVIGELAPQAAEQSTQLVAEAGAAEVTARVDGNQIALATAALIRNALEALALGGRIEVSLSVSEENGGGVEIAVDDSGPGIPAEVRRHMFDPFYSGREAGRGLGFGLSKAWRIARLHGGSLTAEPSESGGARFVLWLPRSVLVPGAATSAA